MTVIYYKNIDGIKSINIDPWSTILQEGESYVWTFVEQRGLIFKHNYKLNAITNYRVFEFNYETNKITSCLMLSDLDVTVMNSFRSYNSIRCGVYGSFARGFGVTGGQSFGTGVTVGQIVFLVDGKPFIVWDGISDPRSLATLVRRIKRELYPKKELQRFLSGIKSDELPSRSTCPSCGTRNSLGSSFCSKCGHVLR